jgi:hypothetical protein
MALHIYPSSSFSALSEHGTKGEPGYPHPAGKPKKIRQGNVHAVTVPAALSATLKRISDDEDLSDKDKAAKMFRAVQDGAPELARAAEGLVAQGQQGQEEFKGLLNGLAKQFGYSYHENIASREIFEQDTDWVVLGPLKGVARTAVKAALDYEGDVGQVKDVVRGTIAVRGANDLVTALSRLSERVEIVSLKDNVSNPMSTGYRDLNLLVRLKTGMLAEVQIIVKPMLQAKMGIGHRLYEAWRVLDPTTPRARALLEQQVEVYSSAWMRAAAGAAFVAQLGLLAGRIKGAIAS